MMDVAQLLWTALKLLVYGAVTCALVYALRIMGIYWSFV